MVADTGYSLPGPLWLQPGRTAGGPFAVMSRAVGNEIYVTIQHDRGDADVVLRGPGDRVDIPMDGVYGIKIAAATYPALVLMESTIPTIALGAADIIGNLPADPIPVTIAGGSNMVAVLWQNTSPMAGYPPIIEFQGTGDAPPSGYASIPTVGPVTPDDTLGQFLITGECACRISAKCSYNSAYGGGDSVDYTIGIFVNGDMVAGVQRSAVFASPGSFAGFAAPDTISHIRLHPGDVVAIGALWSSSLGSAAPGMPLGIGDHSEGAFLDGFTW